MNNANIIVGKLREEKQTTTTTTKNEKEINEKLVAMQKYYLYFLYAILIFLNL